MNTSGMPFRDHAGSMDLCYAALSFASDNLKPGGNFICKFYPGNLDKELEGKMKKLFEAVQRQKPESSRDVMFSPVSFLFLFSLLPFLSDRTVCWSTRILVNQTLYPPPLPVCLWGWLTVVK